MDSGAETTGEAFDEMPVKKPRSDEGREQPPLVSLWAGVHPDILGVVLRFLPCLADRASVRSVCPHWRTAAGSQALPPPLPLLVLPKFRLSCLTSDMALTAPRCPLMPEEVAVDKAYCVGSYDGWLVSVTPVKVRMDYCRYIDVKSVGNDYYSGECFLVNVFSHRVVRLPHLCRTSYIYGHFSCKILPVVNGLGAVRFEINGSYTMSLRKVVLSASPDTGPKYIVAASSDLLNTQIALWQTGMTSWHVCKGVPTKDIAFCQGKLYVLQRSILLAFVLDEDDRGIVVSRVEQCVTRPPLPPHPMEEDDFQSCNMVVWRENLLLIMRYYDSGHEITQIEVFALDFSSNPHGLTKIHSFDGDCIFIGSGSSKSFPAGLHDGVEGDLIYFIPDNRSPCDRFVYNMRDGTMSPFSIKSLPFEGPVDYHFPVWLFPSE